MKFYSKVIRFILLAGLLIVLLGVVVVSAQDTTADAVMLTTSTTTWHTLAYQLDADNGMIPNSLDPKTIVERSFDTYVLENKYLKVTLLPEFGGRILSIIYKPTGHEELYQNPVGVPYGIGEGNFYYNWLMVYGGIFPSFPEPEHGKTWLLPWDFKVVTQTADSITVSMSFTDNIDFKGRPGKFNVGTTGIEATYFITLQAGRAALDTQMVLHNPSDKAVDYEYWTAVTLAPGSQPDHPQTTAGAEIITPVKLVDMPPWWPDTNAQEQATKIQGVYTLDKLRMFKNWPDMGIAYAYPSVGNANFWGVVNHDDQEGLIRVGNNDVTPGMKLWTWGYNSVNVDSYKQTDEESRPYIEMWAGVTPEFFTRTSFAASSDVKINETYSPTVGLTQVTQASRDYLADFYTDDAGNADLQVFSVEPGKSIQAIISADLQDISTTPITFDPMKASTVTVKIPDGAKLLHFTLKSDNGTSLLGGDLVNQ